MILSVVRTCNRRQEEKESMSEYIDNVKLNGTSIPIRDSDAQQKIAQMTQQATGNGIADAEMNADDTLTLTFTDGTAYTTPSLRGNDGHGVPSGGSTGQILRKHSATNYDAEWGNLIKPITVDFGTVSSLPVTKSASGVTADMAVIACEVSQPKAFTGDLTVTPGSGTVTLSGSILGSSTVKLTLDAADTVTAS